MRTNYRIIAASLILLASAYLPSVAQAAVYPMANATSNDVLTGWPASHVDDGNTSTDYSSNYFPGAANTRGTFIATWTADGLPQEVNTVILTARMYQGLPNGFPVNYNVYLTSANNSSWVLIGNFNTQPNATGVAQVSLGATYSTYGVMITPTTLGVDAGNSHYFQMAEINLGYTEIYPMSGAVSNDILAGWPIASIDDGNPATAYSSGYFPNANNTRNTFVAAWNAGVQAQSVDTVLLTARMVNGVPNGFPAKYSIYLTNANNTAWELIGSYSVQPDSAGIARIGLPTTYSTYGLYLIPSVLGADGNGNHYFQMAEINLASTSPAGITTPYHMNAGGPAFVDALGTSFAADTYAVGGAEYTYAAQTIANTVDSSLYQTAHYGPNFNYMIPVANGDYLVTLNFAERSYSGVGQRVLNVTANGSTVLQNYDIFKEAGGANTAVTPSFVARVSTGILDLGFASQLANKNAVVQGISVQAAPKTMSSIKHIITIVQENHSFDSYFGAYCKSPVGSNPTCTVGSDCCEEAPLVDASTGAHALVLNDGQNLAYDNNHGGACEEAEMNNGLMNQYVSGAGGGCSTSLNFVTADPGTLAPYWALASQGTIADHYFQSVAGASYANDMYLAHAGFVFADDDAVPAAEGLSCNSPGNAGSTFTEETVGDLLSTAQVPWTFYAEGYDSMVTAQAKDACPAPPTDCPVSEYPCTFDSGDDPFQYSPTLRDRSPYIRDYQNRFFTDLSAGTLPAVSYVKALGYKTEHPALSSISAGEQFVSSLVEAVQNSQYAKDTLIIVVPDESGGFSDHIAPPARSTVDGQAYGPRLWFIALGPFAQTGGVSHVQMEHSSIVKFIEWNWLGGKTGQLGMRDTVVNNIGSVLNPATTGVTVPTE